MPKQVGSSCVYAASAKHVSCWGCQSDRAKQGVKAPLVAGVAGGVATPFLRRVVVKEPLLLGAEGVDSSSLSTPLLTDTLSSPSCNSANIPPTSTHQGPQSCFVFHSFFGVKQLLSETTPFLELLLTHYTGTMTATDLATATQYMFVSAAMFQSNCCYSGYKDRAAINVRR